jgi:hypothetical protein
MANNTNRGNKAGGSRTDTTRGEDGDDADDTEADLKYREKSSDSIHVQHGPINAPRMSAMAT